MEPKVLHTIITAAFALAETERASLRSSVQRLEPRSRDQLIKKYGEADAWRGLADDNVLTLCDLFDHLEQEPNLGMKHQG